MIVYAMWQAVMWIVNAIPNVAASGHPMPHCGTAWAATPCGKGKVQLQLQQQLIYLLALSEEKKKTEWKQQRMCGTLIFRSTAAATPSIFFLLLLAYEYTHEYTHE